MIKDYTLSNGAVFQTLTIPKGTVLFRGVRYLEDTDSYSLFSELIGHPSTQRDAHCIAPTMNVFFYPVPYVSQCVDAFNVHIVYITNYDIELLLLLGPSEHHRGLRNEPSSPLQSLVKTCSKLSNTDGCGFKMSADDPCFTEPMFEEYPNILGTIAIASTDKDKFLLFMRRFIQEHRATKLIHILPCIVANSRGATGIPEIILHPYHIRYTQPEATRINVIAPTPQQLISYCIHQYPKYNAFPLFYITESNIYTFEDLKQHGILDQIRTIQIQDSNILIYKGLFKQLHKVMSALLSTNGYTRNGLTYQITTELQTGFYSMVSKQRISTNSKTLQNRRKVFYSLDTITDMSTRIPISYTKDQKLRLMRTFYNGTSPYTLEGLERSLNRDGLSLTKHYRLNRGQKQMFMTLQDVFKRHDLKRNRHARTRKQSHENSPGSSEVGLEVASLNE